MISHWLAWISFGCGILLLLQFAAGRSGSTAVRRVSRKTHSAFAAMMTAAGAAHGVLSLTRGRGRMAAVISGLLLLGCALFVCHTWLRRRRYQKKWLRLHRIGSVVFAVLLLLHFVLTLHGRHMGRGFGRL